MASSRIDMSLDDIIKMNKTKSNAGRKNFNQTRRFNQSGYNNFNNPRRNTNFGVSRGSGRVMKNTQRFDSRPSNGSDFTWKHDKFEGYEVPSARLPPSSSSTTIIRISNLNYTVSDQDIKELFGEFGSMIRSTLNYDRSGRSLGSAEVEYSNRASAIKAVEQYNKVPLDGLPMEIALVSNNLQPNMGGRLGAKNNFEPYRRGNFPANSYSTRGGRFQNNRSNNAPPRQPQRNRKEELTKEQLDAELDDYLTKMDH